MSRGAGTGTSPAMADPDIFDRAARRLRRDRAAPRWADHAFLHDAVVDGLLDRLAMVSRSFTRAAVIGAADGRLPRALTGMGMTVTAIDPGARFAALSGGIQADEDRLPLAPGTIDLILSPEGLDMVGDLPGALVQIRRSLVPDGLFMAGFPGAGSLGRLKAALVAGEMAAGGSVSPRVHPQIDVRAAGDLLSRVGFALPVADSEPLSVGYPHLPALLADLRGMAATNILRDRRPLSRAALAGAIAAFADHADADGRVRETFNLIFLTGWAPAPSQPKPARRGSATASLTQALSRS
ncbi:methyltransferase domain-containing protein [Sphingomonas sp. 1P06PA]|uniref:methyltransferase domain-containing protein n=1 Tax=Sphingomonas sp. 1P06PA TaxID=554121 RepID=UPI0039A4184E